MSITDGSELIEPAYYRDHGPPHETWTKLRAELSLLEPELPAGALPPAGGEVRYHPAIMALD